MNLATEAQRTQRSEAQRKPGRRGPAFSVFPVSVLSVSLWLVLSVSLAAQSDAAAGSKLFNPVCSNGYCHGAGGNGGGAPSLRAKKYSAEFLIRVISEGVPNTPMRAFKEDYNKDQIRQLAAYVQSLSGKAADEAPPAPMQTAEIPRSPVLDAGREVFEAHCAACHAIRGTGGKVGPDLSVIAGESRGGLRLDGAGQDGLLKRIVSPAEKSDSAYALISVTTKDERVVTGVKRRETDELIQVYDVSALPPVSRSIAKEDVGTITATGRSAMPGDFGKRLTPKQLADLVAFLKGK